MENKTQEITEELKAKVTEKLKDQIEARDKAQEKVDRLQKALEGYEEKAEKLKGKIRTLNKKITEDLGEGKNVSKKNADLRALRDELIEAEDLTEEIKSNAIIEARQSLKITQDDLKIAVQAAVAEARAKYEEQMRQKLLDFMSIFDAWVSATKALYDEVKPGLLAGTVHEVPRVVCEPFKRYITNIGLGIYEEVIKSSQEEPGPMVEAKIVEEEGEESVERQI